MRKIRLSSAAEKAMKAWTLSRRSIPAPAPSYNLCTSSGFVAACQNPTGAFAALRFLPPRERETARIYDEDGYCLYR